MRPFDVARRVALPRVLRRSTLGAVIATAIAAAGCGTDDPPPRTAGSVPIDNVERGTGYELIAPEGWRNATRSFDGSALRLDLVVAGDPADGFRPNVTVVRETPPGEITLAGVVERFQEQVQRLADDSGIGKVGDITLDGEPAKTYSYGVEGDSSPAIRQRQVVCVRDGAVYTVTFSHTRAAFSEFEPIIDRVLDSWRWR